MQFSIAPGKTLKGLFLPEMRIELVKENQETVNKYMKDLKNPPEQYEDMYEDLKEYYDAYMEFADLVINPTGSLTGFTSMFNAADTRKMQIYFAE